MIEKIETIKQIQDGGIIAVIRNIPEAKVVALAECLISAGVRALEITVDSENAFSVIEKLSKEFKDDALVGAGTVLDSHSAHLAISKGAKFILSPTFNPDVIKTSRRYGKVVIPGVMSPTEMINAIECGADMVKIFPASVLGVQFIKDVKGPLPHIPIIPTGGIDVRNVGSFIEVGVEAVGVGGSLLNKEAINQSNFKEISELASQFVKEIEIARQKVKR